MRLNTNSIAESNKQNFKEISLSARAQRKQASMNRIDDLRSQIQVLKAKRSEPGNNEAMLEEAKKGQELTKEIYGLLNEKNDKHGDYRQFFDEQKKVDDALVKHIEDDPDLFKGNEAGKKNFEKLLKQKSEYLSQISTLLKAKKVDQLKFAELRRNLVKVNTALSMALINGRGENSIKAA